MANKRKGNVKIPELFLLFKAYILLLGRSSLQTYFFISFTPTPTFVVGGGGAVKRIVNKK